MTIFRESKGWDSESQIFNCWCLVLTLACKECVAVLIGLYKKQWLQFGVGFEFVLCQALYTTNPRLVVI